MVLVPFPIFVPVRVLFSYPIFPPMTYADVQTAFWIPTILYWGALFWVWLLIVRLFRK